jgi:uncharacterized protein (TIGR01777 family)
MKILVSGSRGLIGSALVEALVGGGHQVTRLTRGTPGVGGGEVRWDPYGHRLDPATMEGFDAVVHLAGENIEGRWTEDKKRRIYDSRVRGTELLCRILSQLSARPRVLVSASAVGYYGSRGDDVLDEGSTPGLGFLPQVCRDWEAATQPASEAGIRVVMPRIGMVLSRTGGALHRMLPVFRLGLGGPLGSGRQYMSWITLDDLVGAMIFALGNESLSGPVNAVAPRPVTNWEFTTALARAMHRFALLPMPSFVLRAALGPMADELLLSSARVLPRRLLDAGFQFQDAEMDGALERLVGGGETKK